MPSAGCGEAGVYPLWLASLAFFAAFGVHHHLFATARQLLLYVTSRLLLACVSLFVCRVGGGSRRCAHNQGLQGSWML